MPIKSFIHNNDIQTVIWDWNGTLLNDVSAILEAEARQLSRYGVTPLLVEERRRVFGHPISAYYEYLGFDLRQHSFAKLSEEFFKEYMYVLSHEVELFEGVRELLAEIKQRGLRQFILSAAPEDHLHEVVDRFSIQQHFDGIYGLSNKEGDSKIPRARELVRDFAIDTSSCVVVGDTDHDHEVAQAIGAHVLIIADGHQSYEKLQHINPNVIRSRYEMLEHANSL